MSVLNKIFEVVAMTFRVEKLPADSADDHPAQRAAVTKTAASVASWLFRVEPLGEDPERVQTPKELTKRSPLGLIFSVDKLEQDPETPAPPRKHYLRWFIAPEKLE